MDIPNSSDVMIYRIRIKGKLDFDWADWFDGFQIEHTNAETVLTGSIPDQAAMQGLLVKICDLGLTLLSIERVRA